MGGFSAQKLTHVILCGFYMRFLALGFGFGNIFLGLERNLIRLSVGSGVT